MEAWGPDGDGKGRRSLVIHLDVRTRGWMSGGNTTFAANNDDFKDAAVTEGKTFILFLRLASNS